VIGVAERAAFQLADAHAVHVVDFSVRRVVHGVNVHRRPTHSK
jgi:hypothetical protein